MHVLIYHQNQNNSLRNNRIPTNFFFFVYYLPKINSQFSQPNDRSGTTSRSNIVFSVRFFISHLFRLNQMHKIIHNHDKHCETIVFWSIFTFFAGNFSILFRFYAALCLQRMKIQYNFANNKTLLFFFYTLDSVL